MPTGTYHPPVLGGDRSIPLVVIGAGPFGLSVSAHLAAAGIDHVVFGQLMRTWTHHMPDGMFLKSEPEASSLHDPTASGPLERYMAGAGQRYEGRGVPLPIQTFRDYGSWFAQSQGLPIEDVTVKRVEATRPGYLLETTAGTVSCHNIVLATGILPFAHIPPELDGLPPDVVSHASAIRNPGAYRDRDVTIVGGGSSALELAALIHEAGGIPRVLVRGGSVVWGRRPALQPSFRRRVRYPRAALCDSWHCWLYSNAPTVFHRLSLERRSATVQGTFGPAGAWWLRERVDGIVDVRTDAAVTGIGIGRSGIAVQASTTAGPVTLPTDHVIAATGYRPHVDKLAILDPDLRDRIRHTAGYPVLSTRMESSVPGLFVAGSLAAFAFGPAMRFVWGTGFAAQRITAGVRHRLGRVGGAPRSTSRTEMGK
jgi:thioredoxin reductase